MALVRAGTLYIDKPTTVTEGTLEVQARAGDAPYVVESIGTFDVNGVALRCNADASGSATDVNIKFVSRGYGMTVSTGVGTETVTGDFTLNGPLDVNHANNGFYKKGAGSLRLNAPATANNLPVRILGGSIICGVAECIGANAKLVMDAGTLLNLNGFNQTVATLTFGSTQQAAGTWGATGSGATYIDDTRFSGTGMVTVVTGP